MKKFLICLLALCLLVPFLTACDNDGGGNNNSVDVDDQLTVKPIDLGGDEINVLCRNFGADTKSILGYTGEIMYAEESPSTVDEAKREVVDYIQGTFNCTIKGMLTTDSISDIISKQISSQLRDYDIYFDSFRNAAQIATAGYSLDLNTVPTINLSDSWWDQNAVNDLSVNNKLFFVCGDINTYDDQGTWCVLFNKNLKNTLNIEDDFYALASSGKWTFDKFKEICVESGATYDLTGDGQNELDRWAFGTETYNIYVHAVAAGYKIAQKEESTDLPYLTISKQPAGTYAVLQDVVDFYKSKDVMVANDSVYGTKFAPPKNCWEETVHKAFTEGRELFYMCGLINVASFRKMTDEFGILPVPKFYDTQDRYYHTVSIDNSSFMFLPINIADDELEKLGTVISAIAELSQKKVTYAYREVQLKYRDARDGESEAMLETIFNSRTFDLGCAFNWGEILGEYMKLDGSPESNFAAIKSKAETEMQKTIEKLKLDQKA